MLCIAGIAMLPPPSLFPSCSCCCLSRSAFCFNLRSFRFWNSMSKVSNAFVLPGTALFAPTPCVLHVREREHATFLSVITPHCSSRSIGAPAEVADDLTFVEREREDIECEDSQMCCGHEKSQDGNEKNVASAIVLPNPAMPCLCTR